MAVLAEVVQRYILTYMPNPDLKASSPRIPGTTLNNSITSSLAALFGKMGLTGRKDNKNAAKDGVSKALIIKPFRSKEELSAPIVVLLKNLPFLRCVGCSTNGVDR